LGDFKVATVSNLYVDQGSFFRTYVTVSNTDGAPLDLTNYTVASQMRKSYQSSTAYNFTGSITNPVQGRVRIELSSEQSRLIPAGKYLYDLEVTAPNGEKTRVVEGIVLINPEITKI
jgi:hypothetical protein